MIVKGQFLIRKLAFLIEICLLYKFPKCCLYPMKESTTLAIWIFFDHSNSQVARMTFCENLTCCRPGAIDRCKLKEAPMSVLPGGLLYMSGVMRERVILVISLKIYESCTNNDKQNEQNNN